MNFSKQIFSIMGLLIFGSLWITGNATFANADKLLQEQFLREAPQKWLEYRQVIANTPIEGTFTNNLYNPLEGQKLLQKWQVSFAVDGKRHFLSYMEKKGSGSPKVNVYNPKYSFKVSAKNDQKWFIRAIRKKENLLNIPEDFIGRHAIFPTLMSEACAFNDVMSLSALGQRVSGAWFPLLVQSPDFKLIEATTVDGEEGLVKIKFEFETKEKTGGGAAIRSGTAVFDANRYWLIREVEAQADYSFGRGTVKVTSEITDAKGKMPVPYVSHQVLRVSCLKTNLHDVPHVEDEYVFDVDMHEVTDLDEKKFTLSGFGLPEPRGMREEPSREGVGVLAVFLLVVTAVVLLVFAIRIMKRRGTANV